MAELDQQVRDWTSWTAVSHGDSIDPVVAAGMAHYQFETLHPFNDGNGRIGRLLIAIQLLHANVLHEPTLTVSPWFESRRADYYDRLQAVSTTGAWDDWIRFFAEGIAASATDTKTPCCSSTFHYSSRFLPSDKSNADSAFTYPRANTLVGQAASPAVRSRLPAPNQLGSRAPAQSRAQPRRHIGQDLHIVGVLEAEWQRESDLIDFLKTLVRQQLFGDLIRRANDVTGKHHPSGSLRRASTWSPGFGVRAVLRSLFSRRRISGDDDEPLRDPRLLPIRVVGAKGTNLGLLNLSEILRRLCSDHAAGEEVQTLLAGPRRGGQARAAVPDATCKAWGVRLHAVGEDFDARRSAEPRDRLAADRSEQALDSLIREIFDVTSVGVKGLLHLVIAHRRPDADPGIDPAAGEHVHRRQVLGQAERILPAERRDSRSHLDTAGALRRGGHDRDRRGDAELQVAVAKPRTVETELVRRAG